MLQHYGASESKIVFPSVAITIDVLVFFDNFMTIKIYKIFKFKNFINKFIIYRSYVILPNSDSLKEILYESSELCR